ncbi:TPA: hypothetical protein N0F65_003063 [Lagenidium giganteum]|uniref:Leucine-rich repeat domain, L domain-like n=1 Tax=Lagenidium giganteum TaxID=4803 RepID=A0AAV2YGC5_9STRA|nr:TPA: hypothetical protein N0F65_003063 [Lagenidium giganteum]
MATSSRARVYAATAEANKPQHVVTDTADHVKAFASTTPPTVKATVAASLLQRDVLWRVSRLWFRVCWIIVLSVHAAAATYLAHVVLLYAFLMDPAIVYYVDLIKLGFDQRRFAWMMIGYGLPCAVHSVECIRMLWFSLSKRRLLFTPVPTKSKAARASLTNVSTHYESSGTSQRALLALHNAKTWPARMIAAMRYAIHAVFGEHGLLGIKSAVFANIQMLRKLVQVCLQVYQAYHLSIAVARGWINHVAVVVIVFNCLSLPLIHLCLHRNQAMLRVLCLTCDIVLGAVTAVVLPMCIFLPYVYAWNSDIAGYDDAYLYDDLWFINGVMENRQVISTTAIDLLFKVYPFFECWFCLDGLKSLIRCQRRQRNRSDAVSIPASSSQSPTQHSPADQTATTPAKNRQWRLPSRSSLAVDVLFVSIAFVVAIIHAVARDTHFIDVEGCKLPIRPWFTHKVPCAVLSVNCHRLAIQGHEDELSAVLDVLDESSLGSLILMHCPALEMPSTLQRFHNLLGLEVFNSTIQAWPAQSALTQQYNPCVTFLAIVFTNLSGIPDGLLTDLPASLVDIEMSVTNLTQLPDDLDTRWPAVSNFFVEHSHFDEFPPVIGRMPQLLGFSLFNSSVRRVDDELLANMSFIELHLGWNPLQQLPATIGDVSRLAILSLDHTNVSIFPDWLLDNDLIKKMETLSIDATPLCRRLQDDNARRTMRSLVPCNAIDNADAGNLSYVDGAYPLSLVLSHRPW